MNVKNEVAGIKNMLDGIIEKAKLGASLSMEGKHPNVITDEVRLSENLLASVDKLVTDLWKHVGNSNIEKQSIWLPVNDYIKANVKETSDVQIAGKLYWNTVGQWADVTKAFLDYIEGYNNP